MTEFVDLYCERVAPGLFGEPLNLITNAFILLAAWASWRMARGGGRAGADAALLVTLVAAFGMGSALFHSFANTLTRWLDAVPIGLFVAAYFWVYQRRVLGISNPVALVATAVFVVVAIAARQFPDVLNGSLIYAPALVLVAGLGVVHMAMARHEAATLLAAAGCLVAALVMRTVDAPICAVVPIGTHFLWHTGAALGIYLAMQALVPFLPETGTSRVTAGTHGSSGRVRG